MHKNKYTLALALVYASATLYGQEPIYVQNRSTQTDPTSGIRISSFICLKYMVPFSLGSERFPFDGMRPKDIESKDDIEDIHFYLQKIGIDPLIYASSTITVISGLIAAYFRDSSTTIIATGLISALSAAATLHFAVYNSRLTDGQHWVKAIKSDRRIYLNKKNGAWHVWQNTASGQYTPHDIDNANELAEAIIANHDQEVKPKDLYTSPIFEELLQKCGAKN